MTCVYMINKYVYVMNNFNYKMLTKIKNWDFAICKFFNVVTYTLLKIKDNKSIINQYIFKIVQNIMVLQIYLFLW